MSDYPIIFSAPMVRALLDGRKSMTRRLAWRERLHLDGAFKGRAKERVPSPWQKAKPGDRLWVRESWCRFEACSPDGNGAQTYYRASQDNLPEAERVMERNGVKWRPSIHMPRWASRLTLVVTATKVERLQDISEEDAEAEGMREPSLREIGGPLAQASWCQRQVFGKLWVHLHGLESWQQNPEVVALSFEVHKANIDQMAKVAP